MRTKRFTFTMPLETEEQLNYIAEMKQCSLGEAVRLSVNFYTLKLSSLETYKEDK